MSFYKGIMHCFRTILREEGGWLSGSLFRGIAPTLMGVVPYVGLNFLVFESCKGFVLSLQTEPIEGHSEAYKNELPVPWKLVCGSIAGAISQTVTYPFDVVRRRMQMKGTSGQIFSYNSTFHGMKVILQKEGLSGLYKGNIPNLLKVAAEEVP